MRFLFQIFIVAMASLLPGCSTMANLSLDKKVYGGLAMDACAIPMVATAITPNQNPDDSFPLWVKLLFGAGMIIDMPLTLVGDTLTLPITIPAAYRRFTTEFETAIKHSDEATPPPQNEDSCSIDPPHLESPIESAPGQNETQLVLPALSAREPRQ